METKYSNKINILIVYFISILSFFINEELFALTETDKILTEILQRYSFTNKAGNKVYFEFHYDEKIEGLNKNNPVHINQMFILFDLIDFWNTYIRGDFNMGNYIDNKPLFDAIHFSNKRINSISFHEIIQNENIIVVKHNLKYIENPILGSLTIKSFDSDNYGSATYNHWPGASNSYIFKYHKIENEIHINMIETMGGGDFGSYYIGIIDNNHFMSELYKIKKNPSEIDLNDRKLSRKFVFFDNGILSEEHYYNNEGNLNAKKIYLYNDDKKTLKIKSIKFINIIKNKVIWHKTFEYDKKNNLIRILSGNNTINEYSYSTNGLIKEDLRGIYEWDTPQENLKVKIKSIKATSYIDWESMYIPDVIFDGNKNTGWLENKEGPGIGEKITLILEEEITIDEIKFLPGYFDPEWWKSNNRIKKLNFNFGDNELIFSFKDEMKMQSIKLSQPISFSNVVFTIKEIYSSGKDDDTGISEIEFWYKGNKIDIDLPGS